MKRIVVLLLMSSFCFSLTPSDAIKKLEYKLKSIKSLSADFEQIYYSSSFSTPLIEKGKVYFKKPALMRWDYVEPEKKYFVYSNGEFIFYLPEDNQVIKSSQSREKFESEILSILTGESEITQNYKIEYAPSLNQNGNTLLLKLTPFKEKDYSFILLEIQKNKWLIKRAVFFDWAGNKQEFIFSNVKENIVLPMGFFHLNIPENVEIIID